MDHKENEYISEFDEMTTTDRIRMLKAALPYVEIGMQQYMAIYIKLHSQRTFPSVKRAIPVKS